MHNSNSSAGNSKDGRYEKDSLVDNSLVLFLFGKPVERDFPWPNFDVQTWGKKIFFRTRDIKGAWLFDRLTGSRLDGGHSRSHDPFYNRRELVENFDYIKNNLCVDDCSYCNRKLNYGRGYNKVPLEKRGYLVRPSMDRIDNNKGYFTSNVQIICHDCNTKKGTS